MVYASDQVNNNIPPAPPTPPVYERPPKFENHSNDLLSEIERGKELKSVKTREKSILESLGYEKKENEGKFKLNKNESLADKISNKLNEMRSKINDDDSDTETVKNNDD
jgi:hypothetical protein